MRILPEHEISTCSLIPDNKLDTVINNILSKTFFSFEGEKITRKDYLFKIGYLSSTDEGEIRTHCEKIFSQYNESKNTVEEKKEISYQDFVELLILSGSAKLITALDWSVDRIREAEKAHGLLPDGFHLLENLLYKKYCKPGQRALHLHKGPGNGALMGDLKQKRQKSNDTKNRSIEWEEVGIADCLYFTIEDIIFNFVKEDKHNSPFIGNLVSILASVFKRELRKKWFIRTGSDIGTWSQQAPICDMNDLYDVIQSFMDNPISFLVDNEIENIEGIHNPQKGTIRASADFEHDSNEIISPSMQFLLILLEGKTSSKKKSLLEYAAKMAISHAKRIVQKKMIDIDAIQKKLNSLNSRLKQEPRLVQILTKSTDNKWIEEHLIAQYSQIIEHLKNVDILVEPVKKIDDIYESIESVLEQGRLKREELLIEYNRIGRLSSQTNILGDKIFEELGAFFETNNYPKSLSGENFLANIFKPEFLKNIKTKAKEGRLNLNRRAKIFTKNVSFGYFTQIPETYRDIKFLLISATRSDSHEDDEAFEADIHKNLNVLEPGGILITEGIRASFSRRYRIEKIASVLRNHPDIKCSVIVNRAKNNIKTVIFQKKHNDGYLSTEEIGSFIDLHGNACIPFKDIFLDPFTRVISKVRHKILNLTNLDREIFRGLQKRFSKIVLDLLLETGFSILKQNEYFKLLKENIEIAKKYPQLTFSLLNNIDSSEDILKNYGLDGNQTLIKFVEIITMYFVDFQAIIGDHLENDSITQIEDSNILAYLYNISDVTQLSKIVEECVRHNPQTHIISSDSIDVIVTQVLGQISELVITETEKRGIIIRPLRNSGTLKTYNPESINLFHRQDDLSSSKSISPFSIPDNCAFLKGSLANEFAQSNKVLGNELDRIKRQLKYPPILLLSFSDCVTNQLLKETLQKLLGKENYEKYVQIKHIDFRTKSISKGLVRHKDEIARTVNKYCNNGGIIIGGGSWYDAYDPYGNICIKDFVTPIIEALNNNSSGHLRMLGICLSHQMFAEALGLHTNTEKPPIFTFPGPLEFGYIPMTIDNSHPLFKGLPRAITVAQTHSGHVTIDQNYKEILGKTFGLKELSRSTLTGNPVTYEAFPNKNSHGRYLGLQWHPEVFGDKANELIMNELKKGYSVSIQNTFGVDISVLTNNLAISQAKIKGDAGDFILGRAIGILAESIKF